MTTGIIFVGLDIAYNKPFQQYCLRYLGDNSIQIINTITNIYDSHLLDLIEKQKSTHLFIVALPQDFNLISKMISSYLCCDMALEYDLLIPNDYVRVEPHSYLIELFAKKINIIKAQPPKELPVPLITVIQPKQVHIFGYAHEDLEVIIQSISPAYNTTYHIIQITRGWHTIVIQHTSSINVKPFIKALADLLPHSIIPYPEVIPYIIDRFDQKNIFVSFAESCTGGLLSAKLTQYSGASNVFEVGIVSYANEFKNKLLAVDKDHICKQGAVSKQVVADMLQGILKLSLANYAVAISGIAGPHGGDDDKPVGTVYIGVSNGKDEHIEQFVWQGDRIFIQEQSVLMAIKLLIVMAKKDNVL